jgi:septal ring factor EnvC (AmiA/AmiB activator)
VAPSAFAQRDAQQSVQQQTAPARTQPNAATAAQARNGRVQQQVDLLQNRLNLTAEQRVKVINILNNTEGTIETANRETADAGSRIRKGQAAFREANTGINAVLTPQQQEQFRALEPQLNTIREAGPNGTSGTR